MKLIGMKTVTITGKGQIAIPKSMRKTKAFKEGAKLAVFAFQNQIILRPLDQVKEELGWMKLGEETLSKNWLSKEDEKAWKNL